MVLAKFNSKDFSDHPEFIKMIFKEVKRIAKK